ncbi:hypothetical protein [Shewanella gelidii]|uniref:Uncharacterized protein n=1 Tax=Shewanella gelidii TaxID=1642821 RepID=A0A917JT63_9GAMM|nr:hypothetical protein [Shewanella gelidii]MCL1098059.1 hypothetical protein [Shewanella gelidii]GGI85830.1 hypothetical protein GCM10009332_23910 [Shewanella gelidii]
MRVFVFLLLVCLTGCSKNVDTALTDEELVAEFSEHEQQYILLRNMITHDAKVLKKFEIGDDRLGEYRLYDDGWAKQYGNHVSLESVLSSLELTATC